jgi:hypothetical protein
MWLRRQRLGGSPSLQQILFVLGAVLIGTLHFVMMGLFGWPEGEGRYPVGVSITQGFQWGVVGFILLLVGAILIGPYGGRTIGQIMKIGAFFLYGAFLGHALFDYRFGGDLVDPLLYSGSATLVVWFAAFVFDMVDG